MLWDDIVTMIIIVLNVHSRANRAPALNSLSLQIKNSVASYRYSYIKDSGEYQRNDATQATVQLSFKTTIDKTEDTHTYIFTYIHTYKRDLRIALDLLHEYLPIANALGNTNTNDNNNSNTTITTTTTKVIVSQG